jgi:hypothetical protein
MHFRKPEVAERRRSHINDGLDMYGREILVGDLVAKPEGGSNGRASLNIGYIAKIKGGKNYTTTYFERVYDGRVYSPEPIRYSGRCVILQRADGSVPTFD